MGRKGKVAFRTLRNRIFFVMHTFDKKNDLKDL